MPLHHVGHLAGGGLIGGSVVGLAWFVLKTGADEVVRKVFHFGKNGKSNLTMEQHKELCEPIKKRLDTGDIALRDLRQAIDENHKETVKYLMEIKFK